jgi:hypothetical protein
MEELQKVSRKDKETFRRHYNQIHSAFEKLVDKNRDEHNAVHSYRSKVYFISKRY